MSLGAGWPPICTTGVRARTLAERVGRKHVGRAGCLGSEGCRRVGSLHVGGLWDQLERDPEQMAPVMATMLRDQLFMANRLQQTVAAESKKRAARRTLEETPQPFSRWLLAEEDLRPLGWNWWRMLAFLGRVQDRPAGVRTIA